MIIHLEVTIQPSIQPTDPSEYVIPLAKGTLTRVQISPAPGPNWEVYCRVLHFENPIIPDNTDEWIPLERESLVFYPNYDNWNKIYSITLQLCSPQARYSHTIQFIFELTEKESSDVLLAEILKKGM